MTTIWGAPSLNSSPEPSPPPVEPSAQTRNAAFAQNSCRLSRVDPPAASVFRIHDILVWIRIRGSMPLTNRSDPDADADPDPSIFITDLQDANKKLNF
jgi:hypothetical protein